MTDIEQRLSKIENLVSELYNAINGVIKLLNCDTENLDNTMEELAYCKKKINKVHEAILLLKNLKLDD